MLTQRQRWFYFGLWKQAKAKLMNGRETWTGDEENKRRHEITVRALGRDKSSNDFTRSDFDKIIGELKAIIDPSNLHAQLRQQDQPKLRILFGLRKLMREMDVSDAYVLGVAEQIDNGIDPNSVDAHWQRERQRSTSRPRRLDDYGVDQLKSIMSALHSIKLRGGQQALSNVRHYKLEKII